MPGKDRENTMPDIELRELLKIYPFAQVKGLLGRKKHMALLNQQKAMPYITNEGVIVLQHVSARIRTGEFVVLLGPSGCGKTTLLRLIAGLEEPTLGEVLFDGKCMNGVPPEDRDVAMVFQNFSLYPHLTAFDNIAFPLRNLHIPREELESTVTHMARLLNITDCLERLPSQMSGGQLQRVAIARALVRRPKVFLLDEPFSNLDAPMRSALRQQIKLLHKELGTTFLYVTHDQTEALSLGERILVMRDGIVVQDGTPSEIYNHPKNTYVACAVGTPQMNLVPNIPVSGDGSFFFLGQCCRLTPAQQKALTGDRITVGIRPVNIHRGNQGTPAAVDFLENLGSEVTVHLKAEGQPFTAVFTAEEAANLMRGQQIPVVFPVEKLHIFASDGSRVGI